MSSSDLRLSSSLSDTQSRSTDNSTVRGTPLPENIRKKPLPAIPGSRQQSDALDRTPEKKETKPLPVPPVGVAPASLPNRSPVSNPLQLPPVAGSVVRTASEVSELSESGRSDHPLAQVRLPILTAMLEEIRDAKSPTTADLKHCIAELARVTNYLDGLSEKQTRQADHLAGQLRYYILKKTSDHDRSFGSKFKSSAKSAFRQRRTDRDDLVDQFKTAAKTLNVPELNATDILAWRARSRVQALLAMKSPAAADFKPSLDALEALWDAGFMPDPHDEHYAPFRSNLLELYGAIKKKNGAHKQSTTSAVKTSLKSKAKVERTGRGDLQPRVERLLELWGIDARITPSALPGFVWQNDYHRRALEGMHAMAGQLADQVLRGLNLEAPNLAGFNALADGDAADQAFNAAVNQLTVPGGDAAGDSADARAADYVRRFAQNVAAFDTALAAYRDAKKQAVKNDKDISWADTDAAIQANAAAAYRQMVVSFLQQFDVAAAGAAMPVEALDLVLRHPTNPGCERAYAALRRAFQALNPANTVSGGYQKPFGEAVRQLRKAWDLGLEAGATSGDARDPVLMGGLRVAARAIFTGARLNSVADETLNAIRESNGDLSFQLGALPAAAHERSKNKGAMPDTPGIATLQGITWHPDKQRGEAYAQDCMDHVKRQGLQVPAQSYWGLALQLQNLNQQTEGYREREANATSRTKTVNKLVRKTKTAVGADYDPIRQNNMPFVTGMFSVMGGANVVRRIPMVRRATPVQQEMKASKIHRAAAGGTFTDAQLDSAFVAFLATLDEGEHYLLINRESRQAGSNPHTDAERPRSLAKEALDGAFEGRVTAVTIPTDGDYYRQTGEFGTELRTVQQVGADLEATILNNAHGFYFSDRLCQKFGGREAFAKRMRALVDETMEEAGYALKLNADGALKEGRDLVTHDDRRAMIFHVLNARMPAELAVMTDTTMMDDACRDDVDRGAMSKAYMALRGADWDMVNSAHRGDIFTREQAQYLQLLQDVNSTAFGPALMVMMREVFPDRLDDLQNVLRFLHLMAAQGRTLTAPFQYEVLR